MWPSLVLQLRTLAVCGGVLALSWSGVSGQFRSDAGPKSGDMALALSIAGTLGPVAWSLRGNTPAHYALMGGGLVLGPVLGNIYADHDKTGWVNAATRAAVLGGSFGLALLIRDPNDETKHGAIKAALVLGGAITTTVLTVLDITRVDDRVQAWNQVHAGAQRRLTLATATSGQTWIVQPAYFPSSGRFGLGATWRY